MDRKTTIIIYAIPLATFLLTTFFLFILIRMNLYCQPSVTNCQNHKDIDVSINELIIFGILSFIFLSICIVFLILKINNMRQNNECCTCDTCFNYFCLDTTRENETLLRMEQRNYV